MKLLKSGSRHTVNGWPATCICLDNEISHTNGNTKSCTPLQVQSQASAGSSNYNITLPRMTSVLAVIVGDNAGLALSRPAAPLDVTDCTGSRVAAVEGIVDIGADGGVGCGLEFGVGVACEVGLMSVCLIHTKMKGGFNTY